MPGRVGAGKTVLLADDDADLVDVLAARLRAGGYEVLCAHDGEEALRLATAERPQVIILDLLMPKLDGNEVAQRLKAEPATATILVMFLSGLGALLDADRTGRTPDGRRLLSKPIDAKKLLKLVEQVLAAG